MDDCATNTMRFETQAPSLSKPPSTGDASPQTEGFVAAEVDAELGLCEAISECVPEWRKRKARHSLASLVRQRVFQIACGYEDQNDSDTLARRPSAQDSAAALCPRAATILPASRPSAGWRTRPRGALATE